MRALPPLTAIRAFEAAGRNENFTAAANELGMTQAAVSYQVKALEERLGSALFVREKGRVRLTPLGSRLLPPLTQALDAIEAIFASEREEDESLLTITTTYTFANTWLAWRLGGFQVAHPDLAVRMAASDKLIDLRAGDADVAIRAGRADWEGLEQHRLFEADFTPMASPEYIAAAERKLGRSLVPADLLDLSLISPQDNWWKQWLGDWGVTDDGPPRHAGIRLDTQAHEGNAAMGGQGFALLTPLLWASDVLHGRLTVPFPEKLSRRGWSYWLVFPPERRMVPKIKRFREWMLAEVAQSMDQARSIVAAIAAE
ncbi:MAG TPA: LysR substrate-binding domain-containing protein [Sphingomicrobium sp.]|nr:LysR substrate-binding domain-containing protein [Sphingomicrobium sp.]